MTPNQLKIAVRECLSDLPRGAITNICMETALTQSELSRFSNCKRDLTDTKFLILLAWLESSDYHWRAYIG